MLMPSGALSLLLADIRACLGPEVERKGDGLHGEGVGADEEAAEQHALQAVRRRHLVCNLQQTPVARHVAEPHCRLCLLLAGG
jgi:hypothetical protein